MNRRNLLQACIAAGILGRSATAMASTADPKYLVLVELSGGNDGLNTLVPFGSDDYMRARPSLQLGKNKTIYAGSSGHVGDLGFNSELRSLVDGSWENDLAVVTGLGYPAPSRSHFSSIYFWETGSDGQSERHRGWVTDSVERQFAQAEGQIHGLTLNGSMGLFGGGNGAYLSLAGLRQLQGFDPLASQSSTDNPFLNLIAKRKHDLVAGTSRLQAALDRFASHKLPVQTRQNPLGRQFRDGLRIIAAGLDIPVLHVQQRSYDTHRGQAYPHSRLLEDLSANLATFRQGVKKLGRWDDVLVLTYSEFGRRVAENGNLGTDHGTASNHFLMGGRVRSGIFGEHPRLDQLVDGDMQYSMDYRALYEQVCSSWWRDSGHAWGEFKDPRLSGILRT